MRSMGPGERMHSTRAQAPPPVDFATTHDTLPAMPRPCRPAPALALLCAMLLAAPVRAEGIEPERLLQHFDELVLHRSGDDSKSGQVRKWVEPIRVRLIGTQTGFYGPDAVAALRRIAAVAGVAVEEVPEESTNANYTMEFMDTAFLLAAGRTASCVARTRTNSEGRILWVHLLLNYRNPLGMRRCVDHEIGHSFGFGHSHIADSVMSYAAGRATMTPLDHLILRALYDKRMKPGTARLAALEQVKTVLAELAGEPPGPADYLDTAAARMAADAEAGDIWTQNQLGWAYESGEGRSKDYAEALRWYRRSAEAGNSFGMFKLGWFATKGLAQPADDALAIAWYRKAAALRHAVAQNNLGFHFREGKGAPADTVEAMMWFEIAARTGYALAIRNRDELAGTMPAADLAEARRRAESWKPGS